MEKQKVRIVAMSDTHDLHHKINIQSLPDADIFIHAGDFTKFSMKEELTRFRQFLQMLPYKHKVVIAGNHDFALDTKNYDAHLKKSKHTHAPLNSLEEIAKLKQVCTYLQHELVEIEGVRIFGSPYQPEYFDWGFMYAPNQAQEIWKTIPSNIDILVTHGPPYGILDKTMSKQLAGCKGLLKFVQEIKPQAHVFGHIHEGYGMKQVEGIRYCNASNVNFSYKYVNAPLEFEVEVRNQAKKKE